jgi:hypothetical protein
MRNDSLRCCYWLRRILLTVVLWADVHLCVVFMCNSVKCMASLLNQLALGGLLQLIYISYLMCLFPYLFQNCILREQWFLKFLIDLS